MNPGPRQQPIPIAPSQLVSPLSHNETKPQLEDPKSAGSRRDWVNLNPQSSRTPSTTTRSQSVASANTNNAWQNRGNQNIPNTRRDWANPNPLPRPTPLTPQTDSISNNNNYARITGGNEFSQGSRRDFVNPQVTNFQTSTTPWPQLGQRRAQQPNQPQGPSSNSQVSNQNINLADILKGPSHSPGWNIPVSSTTKTPSSGPGQLPQQPPSHSNPTYLSGQDAKDDNELKDFSENLLKKDVNNAAKYVTINYQHKTSSRSSNDEAPQP